LNGSWWRSVRDLASPRHPLLWSVAGVALGIGLLYASTRRVDAAALLGVVKTVSWPWCAAVLAATLAFCWLKALRWSLLLGQGRAANTGRLHAAVYAGLAVNYLVAHVGEVLRAAMVGRGIGAPVSAVLATVVIERVLDFLAMLAILAVVITRFPDLPAMILTAAALCAAFVALAVAALYALARPPGWAARLAAQAHERMPKRVSDRLARLVERFRSGLASLGRPRVLLLAVLVSILQWSIVLAAIAACARAVHNPASLVATTATFVLVILGLTLPNSPLQVGTTQLAFVVGLGVDGVSDTGAIAASLVYTAFLILPVMVIGAAVLASGRQPGRDIQD
jgi:uncharacterized protein (TIRG00374 family)